MDLQSYCDSHFNDIDPPIFLADTKTDRILYLNNAMKSLLNQQSHIIGRKFYEVIGSRLKDVIYREERDWDFDEFSRDEVFSSELNMRFSIRHLPFDFKGVTYNLCKYFPLEHVMNLKISLEEAMGRCVFILQQKPEQLVPSFLELLGAFYDAEKTYLYKIDTENKKIFCEHSWCVRDDILVTQELGTKMDIDTLLEWSELCNEVGIIEVDSSLSSYQAKGTDANVLNTFGLDNLVLNVMKNSEGIPIYAVVVSNRKELRADFALLQSISSFIEHSTSREELLDTLHKVNEIDILTGFYKRSSYLLKIEEMQNNLPNSMGVVFVNVNGVKLVNFEFGYARGDSRIKQSAELVKKYFHIDFYRISGDEFVGFYDNIAQHEFEKYVWDLCREMQEEKNYLFSVGHAWGSGSLDILQLVQEADTMMYINKQEFYHISGRRMEEVSDATLGELLTYLKNDEFVVYLQPQMYLADNSLYGAEALIRRIDKKNNTLVFPDEFISLYEKKSVIRHIDIFVLNQVCKALKEWGKKGKQIPISVNLSRVTLLEYGIVNTIAEICDSYGIPHGLLVIEVTERVGLIENKVASALIDSFKKCGFKISLDDFGSAYSNIVTLAQIPLDEVKIDKSLVDDLVTNSKNAIIVKHMVSMCNELEGSITLAEGVETKEQADLLRDFQCKLVQGYLYSKPIPMGEFYETFLSDDKKNIEIEKIKEEEIV